MDNINKELRKNKFKILSVGVILAFLLFISCVISVGMGTMKISSSDVLNVIISKITGINRGNMAENVAAVVWNIRLPRIICAAVVGTGLAISGVIFQGILQNPLADPYTLGISTGASFGASLAIIINMNLGIYFPTSVAALIGAALTLVIVITISHRGKSLEGSNLIIAGIIISSILSSGVSFIKMLAGENVNAIIFWIMGSMSAKSWGDVILVTPVVVICLVISCLMAGQLDIMALGDDNAEALGINTNRLRLIYLIIASVMTSVCVAVCGVIGFVGLIIPHLLRLWLTARNSVLMPLSALAGALLLMVADSITRIFTAGEIPVGVLTTLIGGPFFIFIFTRRRGNGRNF